MSKAAKNVSTPTAPEAASAASAEATTALEAKGQTQLAAIPDGAWGAPAALASELVLPRIQIMQGMSDKMKDKALNARLGEIRESLEGRLLGSDDKPVTFIPFFINKTWVNREKKNGKFEYHSTEPRTAINDDLPWEYTGKTEDGKAVDMTREKVINVYVLIPSEVDSGEYLPYVLGFSRTSYKAGRNFLTMVEMMSQGGKPIAARNFELRSVPQENDKGSWFGPDVKKLPGDTKREHLAAAYKWYQTVCAGMVKVDEPDAEPATEEGPSGTREY